MVPRPDAIAPLVILVVLIGGSLLLFGLDAFDGPIQVALILSVLAVAVTVLKNGYSWDDVEHAAQGSLASPPRSPRGRWCRVRTWETSSHRCRRRPSSPRNWSRSGSRTTSSARPGHHSRRERYPLTSGCR